MSNTKGMNDISKLKVDDCSSFSSGVSKRIVPIYQVMMPLPIVPKKFNSETIKKSLVEEEKKSVVEEKQ